jgi:hypothetical protein
MTRRSRDRDRPGTPGNVPMQLPLHLGHPKIRVAEPFFDIQPDTTIRSPPFRPRPLVPCEHMFSSLRTSPLAQRTLGALDLARSFLMLEDDYDVDWEVDRDEPSSPVHPHRAPLGGRRRPRREGAVLSSEQHCTSPTFYGQPTRALTGARRWNARATRESTKLPAHRGSYPEGQRRDGRPETRATRCERPSGCDRHDRLPD